MIILDVFIVSTNFELLIQRKITQIFLILIIHFLYENFITIYSNNIYFQQSGGGNKISTTLIISTTTNSIML